MWWPLLLLLTLWSITRQGNETVVLYYVAQVVTEGHGLVLGLHQSDLPPGVGHVNPGGALLAGPAVVPGEDGLGRVQGAEGIRHIVVIDQPL